MVDPKNEPDDSAADGDPAERERERTRVQVRLILEALDDVAVDPPDWETTGEVNYLYRQGVVLVRDGDVTRVQQIVGGQLRRGLVGGLSAYQTELPTPAALARLDDELGPGLATPEHVLWVTPGTFCPAVEPEVVPKDAAAPEPRLDDPDCTGEGVRVSVVDTGWWPQAAPAHSWLAGVTGDEEDPFDPAGGIREYGGHGTFAAAVVRSVAPRSTVRVEGVLTRAGACFESDLVRQLYDALAWAPDVITVQAGTTTRRSLPLLGLQVLWETRLGDCAGTVLLAAAGNDGSTRPFWPAAFPWAVGVGGLVADESARATWSNHGPWVDVYARGEGHVNAYLDGTYRTVEPQSPAGQVRDFTGLARWSGTSFSTPLVAGLVASRMSRTGEPAPDALREILRLARRHALSRVGPVARLWMGCPDPQETERCPGCWRCPEGT